MDVKNIFAKNLNYYLNSNGKTRKDLCKVLGVSYSAVTAWVNGKKYPRMDKVDEMAKYFGISRAHLTEENFLEEKLSEELEKAQDLYIDIIFRLHTDEQFYSYVKHLMDLEPEKILALNEMLNSFHVPKKQFVDK